MKRTLHCLAGLLLSGLSICSAPVRAAPRSAPVPSPLQVPEAHPAQYIAISRAGVRIAAPRPILVRAQDDRCPSHQVVVAVGHDAALEAGSTACDVISVLGNATADGIVTDSTVAVLGDLFVNGTVDNSAVSVFGSNTINGSIGGNAVSIFGDMTLGPKASVQGQVVNLFGTLRRDPAAIIRGQTLNVMAGLFHGTRGLQAWSRHCLIFGRLLAPRADIGWAWGFAAAILLFYMLLATLFREGLQRCMQTLDDHPGPSILAALAMVLLMPILTVSLLITVIGVFVIPLFWFAMLCAGIFGRVVALGWLGRRVVHSAHGGLAQPALYVLIGGLLALLLYMIPALGFIAYAAIGLLGFGAVIYTLFSTVRTLRGATSQATASAGVQPTLEQGPDTPCEGAAAATPIDWTTLPRAGFWIRIAALLIDLVLVGFVMSLISRDSAGTLLVLAGYGAVMWKLRGTTVGGIICNLHVVRIDGRPLGWETAVLRALGCFLSLVAAGLGFIWIVLDHEHQAWHDKIAGTVVVLVPKVRGHA